MSSTFVEFQGQGFHANDATLEVWLALLVDEIDALEEVPDWLDEMRDSWDLSATSHYGFGVMPLLDQYAADKSHRDMILELAARAYRRMEAWGETAQALTLNEIRDWGEGYRYPEDIPAEDFRRPARYFMRLLRGELGADELDARIDTGTKV
jgi:hypothetical protein